MPALREAPKILVVDDTPMALELVQSVLDAEGFHTLAAENGAQATEMARSHQPDLILLDVMMPGETGFETCARLKSDPATTDIPIIFLSALDDLTSKVTGLKIGGVDYISKPVHAEEVLARVRVHLRIHSQNRTLLREQRARLERLRDAQQAILVRPEHCPDARFSVYYRPLEEAGGDFYDVLSVDPDVVAYFVADISGHGVNAGFLTSAVKALLRQYSGPMFSPEDTMRGIGSVMRQMLDEEQYLTACYVRLNRRTRSLSVVSAGHPPLIVVSAAGKAETLDMESEPLGLFSTAVLQRRDRRLRKGDRFYLYTDGMIESATNGNRRTGLAQLVEACIRNQHHPLESVTRSIVGDILAEPAKAPDDLLLMAAEANL
ncbi:MAG: SpoIIE family protein phosphatase [Acidobacteria bacterium]|nr:SpoIIE family protein phosphatase [Acidobacteriota bacterium]